MPVELTCLNCGKSYKVSPYEMRRGRKFCSFDCFVDYAKKHLKEKTTRICDYCNKKYTIGSSRWRLERETKHTFCSVKCKGDWMRKNEIGKGKNSLQYSERVKKICKYCGNEFEVIPSYAERAMFCSRKCWYDWRKEHPEWTKVHKVVNKICKYCGKGFEISLHKIKRRAGTFCSRECRYAFFSENFREENHPRYTSEKRICKVCGNEFKANQSRIKKGQGIYCSIRCARQMQKIPKHHTQPELIFEQICQKNNQPFHYVGDGELWIGKTKKLNPDFVECNGKKIVIEIMGDYWHSPLLNMNMHENLNLNYRKRFYKKYGWKAYFFWESDLKREDAEQFVLSKLSKSNY